MNSILEKGTEYAASFCNISFFKECPFPNENDSPASPPSYDSDNFNDDSSPNLSDISSRIKFNEEVNGMHNTQRLAVETPREKDKMRIKQLESEIRVLQVITL